LTAFRKYHHINHSLIKSRVLETFAFVVMPIRARCGIKINRENKWLTIIENACGQWVTDAAKVGLESTEKTDIDKFIQSVLLACNLVLGRAAFSKHSFDASDTKIEFQDNNTHS
jgi:hypothetical protein